MSNDFFLYDRITYTIMYFSREVSLEYVVKLSSKRRDGNRQFYHSEFEKMSMYRLTDKSRTVRIRPRFFFNIAVKDNFDGGFIIKPSDVYLLVESINKKVLPWFFGKDRIFSVIDDKLEITGEYQQYMYPQSEYKYLSMMPNIHKYEDGKFKEGVRMYLNSPDVFVDLTLDDLLGFLHILKTTDMVTLAANMCNYTKTQPYGVNMGTQETGLGASVYREFNYEPTNLPPRPMDNNNSANDFLSGTKSK